MHINCYYPLDCIPLHCIVNNLSHDHLAFHQTP